MKAVITHPQLDYANRLYFEGEEVADDTARLLIRYGYAREIEDDGTPPVEPDAFDPGEATVSAVEQHVDNHPDDLTRVLDAERAGKARTTLLASLEARIPEPAKEG